MVDSVEWIRQVEGRCVGGKTFGGGFLGVAGVLNLGVGI